MFGKQTLNVPTLRVQYRNRNQPRCCLVTIPAIPADDCCLVTNARPKRLRSAETRTLLVSPSLWRLVAQWFGCRSLVGGFSLSCAKFWLTGNPLASYLAAMASQQPTQHSIPPESINEYLHVFTWITEVETITTVDYAGLCGCRQKFVSAGLSCGAGWTWGPWRTALLERRNYAAIVAILYLYLLVNRTIFPFIIYLIFIIISYKKLSRQISIEKIVVWIKQKKWICDALPYHYLRI